MPRPAEAGHRYIPGLDGLRALAVVAVILYHLNVGWAQGGLLGVGVFFTLSGYLITDLLMQHWRLVARPGPVRLLAAPRPAAAARPDRDAGGGDRLDRVV